MSLLTDTIEGKTRPTRIHLLSSRGDPRIEEEIAAAAITPGHLIEVTAAGKVQKHSVAGGSHERKFALEDSLQGRTIRDAYAADEIVRNVHAEPGDVVFAFLASGEHATPDEYLSSNGDGTLKVASSTQVRVAKALEEVDRTDTESEDGRIRVRVV